MLGGLLVVLRVLVALASLSPPSYWIFVEIFFLGVILFHKRFFPNWLNGRVESAQVRFYRSLIVYFVPAALLVRLILGNLFFTYLPKYAKIPDQIPPLVLAAALYAVATVLIFPEFRAMRR